MPETPITIQVTMNLTVDLEITLTPTEPEPATLQRVDPRDLLEEAQEPTAICRFCGQPDEACPYGGANGCYYSQRFPVLGIMPRTRGGHYGPLGEDTR